MLFLVAKLEVFREITRNYGNNSLISFREIHSQLLQQFKSFFHTVTQIINHSEIFVHIPQGRTNCKFYIFIAIKTFYSLS